MPQVVAVLTIGIALYLSFGLFVFMRQSSFVYYPHRPVDVTPQAFGLAYEDVRLPTEDGETIAGWYVPAKGGEGGTGTNGVVLHCHGNGGNIADRLGMIRTFIGMGMDVMIFDYRGYGESTGKPTEQGTYQDGLAAWKYLTETRKIPAGRIILHGQSLGGGIASWLAEKHMPGMLVLESTFTSAPDMAVKMFPILPVRLVCRFDYGTIGRLKNIHCPVIVAHSPYDEMIPYENALRLFVEANDPKTLIEMQGSHNAGGIEINEEAQRKIVEYARDKMGQ